MKKEDELNCKVKTVVNNDNIYYIVIVGDRQVTHKIITKQQADMVAKFVSLITEVGNA